VGFKKNIQVQEPAFRVGNTGIKVGLGVKATVVLQGKALFALMPNYTILGEAKMLRGPPRKSDYRYSTRRLATP
jgi:hypothetical protein